jgi:fatty-acyl-CoA synthase
MSNINPSVQLQQAHRPADPDRIVQTTVGELLRGVARRLPERVALIEGGPDRQDRRRLTYRQLLDLAECGATELLSRIPAGSNVAIWAPNSLDWVILEFACALAGLPLVMINPAFTGHEAGYILRQSKSVVLFVAPQYRDNPLARRAEEIRHELPDLEVVADLQSWSHALSTNSGVARELPLVRPDSTAAIQYTSGTTGKPKGAMQSHLAAVNVARGLTAQLQTPKGSVWLLPLPLYSVGGSMFKVIGTLWNEGSLVIVPDFDPGLILQLIEEEQVAFFSAVPTMYLRLFEHPDFARRDLRSLVALCCGGSTVAEDLVQKIERVYGAEYIMMFGLTEMCGTVCQTVRGDTTFHKSRTIGRPLPGIEVKIVSTETGETLGVNTPGEICVRGVGRMQRYFDMPEATSAAIDAEGWLRTGDIGTITEDGYCTITGRLKDMIRRGGMNIYPREIEDVLVTHAAVAEAIAFGVADDHWGEQVVAAVRLRPGASASAQDLETFLRERLARHKVPRAWDFVERMPVNAMGKVQKNILRDEYLARQRASAP